MSKPIPDEECAIITAESHLIWLNDSFRAKTLHRSMTGIGVRRAKAALSQWVRDPPGNYRSGRKQLEQSWR